MTIGNFLEILGTDGFDSLTGFDLEILYGVEDKDSLVADSLANTDDKSITILVGGSGSNLYSVRENATAIILENSNSNDNTLFTTVLASGINIEAKSFVVADIDNRHLYFGNLTSNQYVFLVDWQKPENRLENFDFVNETISYDTFVNSYQNATHYLGNLTWEEAVNQDLVDLGRLGIEPTSIEDSLNTIIERSLSLENNTDDNTNNFQIGNFDEVLGIDGYDSISGADLEIVYALEGNDILNSFPHFNGGSLPNGGETTILVGGSGSNDYQVRNNSTAIVIENDNRDDNILWTTIGNQRSVGIGLNRDTSFFTEIENRHLYLGDIASNQYVILVDWQQPENQIELFDLVEGRITYTEFANNFRDSAGYRGNITWDELPEQIDLQRLGLDANSIENSFTQIRNRATELEESNNLQTIDFFRFRNTSFATGSYLFVAEEEKSIIQNDENLSNSFALDGVTPEATINPAFKASLEVANDLLPFYRLSSNLNPGTFLFVSTEEYNDIFAENSTHRNNWEKQGLNTEGEDIPEFYLHGVGSRSGIEFHRFQNRENGTFLFAGETETFAIQNDPNLSNLFIDQGVAFKGL